ncbi:hypothetical protein ACFYTQ_30825 [Nocardia sp. NPDC004068]|uniref:hypothetical protein n=1 Tax=Nocardia sp. NPDC004068 TaxID=3364303 RepID=UPI00368B1818
MAKLDELEAKLLLLGMDALPVRERPLLMWLVRVGADVGADFLEFTRAQGIDFQEMASRWNRMGLLATGYDWERDCSLWMPSDRAVDLVYLSETEWVMATIANPVDLDARDQGVAA